MRYIGDLLTLNNSKEINPVELSLKRTESCTVVSYSDICICIYMMNNRLVTTVYDKRDTCSFDFHVPFLDSIQNRHMAYYMYMYMYIVVG